MKMSNFPTQTLRLAAVLAVSAALGACATVSPDGFKPVADATQAQLGKHLRWSRSADERAKSQSEVAALLAQPLNADDAIQIALLNNHDLQAAFEQLGISEADLVQSGRLPNPGFTFRHASAAGLYTIEETLTFNLLSLVTVPYAHAAEQRRFAQAQSELVVQVLRLADRTRTAYYTALAARDTLHYTWQVKNAAETGAELAHRMLGAGNWTKLDQARQQSFYIDGMQDLARAQLAEETSRASLWQLLGLADERDSVHLAAQVPELPQNIASLPNLEQSALQNRYDLQLRRAELDELARRLKLTKATRFVNVLDVGPTRVRDGTREDPYEKGYEVSLEIPIFDTGAARVRKSEAVYARAAELYAQAAIDARAQIVTAAARYRIAFESAVRVQEEVMPLRRAMMKQDLLRFNASLISVFELLADARSQIDSVNDSIASRRDFWIAKSHLDAALIAGVAQDY